MVTRSTEIPDWYPLAGEILAAAIDRDQERSFSLLQLMGERHGDHWPEIMFAWIDALLAAQGVRVEDYGKKRFHLHLHDVDNDTVDDQDKAGDPVQWVSALCQARAMDDRDAYYDLLRQITTDKQFSSYVATLVQCVGLTVGKAINGSLEGVRTRAITHTHAQDGGTDERH